MKIGSVILCCIICQVASQRTPTRRCGPQGRTQCPMTAPFMEVSITQDNTYRYVQTTTCPVYNNPGWNNPNEACEFQKTYRLPLVPVPAQTPIPVAERHSVYENITYLQEDPRPLLGALGVLISGVNIYGVGSPCGANSPCPDEGGPTLYVDAVESEGRTVDDCGGHSSGQNVYHIHSGLGINTTQGRVACGLPADTPGEHSELLGWMFDGYGIYGRYSLNGEVPTDLDSCGGHTHLLDGEMVYHYHLPDGYPWIIGCFKGCPDVSNNERQLSFANSEVYGCPVEYPTVATVPSTDTDSSTILSTDTDGSTSGCVRHLYSLVTFIFPVALTFFAHI